MKIKNLHFGEHVTLDGYGGNPKLLNNKKIIISILYDFPKELGMKSLSKPMIVSAPDNGMKDPGGWSGFVIIAESHISIHTFPKRCFVSADVYSCKNNIDIKKITNHFKKTFKLSSIEVNFIKRGKNYPSKNLI